MLQLQNTPDPDCNLLLSEIVFGCPLPDTLSFANRLEKYSYPNVWPLWREAWTAKEEALRTRKSWSTECLKAHTRPLRPLSVDDKVRDWRTRLSRTSTPHKNNIKTMLNKKMYACLQKKNQLRSTNIKTKTALKCGGFPSTNSCHAGWTLIRVKRDIEIEIQNNEGLINK